MELYLRDPDPRARLDVVLAPDPVILVLNILPPLLVLVDPLGELGKRVPVHHAVRETAVRELQPLAPLDSSIGGVLADRPAVSQPYAAPPFLSRTAVPPPADLRQRVPSNDMVPLEPI